MPAQRAQILFSGADAAGHNIQHSVRPFRVAISPIAGGIRLTGDEIAVSLVAEMMWRISEAAKAGQTIDEPMVNSVAASAVQETLKHELAFRLNGVCSAVRPMSLSQVAFMNAMLFSDCPLIFGVGPTGTGKTHLAIAAGLNLIADKHFKTMVVTRPRGMLEGDVMTAALRAETVNDEQLTPIEDELHELIGKDATRDLIEQGLLEITPLGRMRGRSFNDCFLLVDEAQNMGKKLMRMALTRLGRNARMVVTGDPAQVALAGDEPSGLAHILKHVTGTDIALVHRFQNHQIIRNPTVARIEAIYSSEDDPEIQPVA
jgi:phosphate starvation-inducible protein PhoH and related proteins